MHPIFDESKYDNVELFRLKNDREVRLSLEERCEKKSAIFLKARQEKDFETQFKEFCEYSDIMFDDNRFVYFFDFDFRFHTSIQNITPGYEIILNNGLRELLFEEEEMNGDVFAERYNSVLMSLKTYLDRIVRLLEERDDETGEKKAAWFENIWEKKAGSFEEAIQRVLFVNQLMWQTGSGLVGLGRLDVLLCPFFENDIKEGKLTPDDAKEMLKDALLTLHRYTWFKSGVLLGDMGQVIVVGGSNPDTGEYEENDLTRMLIELIAECHITDPKVVLRVNSGISRETMELAVRCMQTGVGSPLLANDDVIIPRLLEFGINREDAYQYSTSACWETLIGGKSSSMNNQASLSFSKTLHDLLSEEPTKNISNFQDLKNVYFRYLKHDVKRCRIKLNKQIKDRNTLYSVFINGCRENRKDIVDGGARYHNVGITTVGLGNAVNSLLNINRMVYEEKKYSFDDVRRAVLLNYESSGDMISELKGNAKRYGVDDPDVIGLTNEIISKVTEYTKDYRTPDGGSLKFGVSSPQYIMQGEKESASFDGRKDHEPLQVHISDEYADSYTQVIRFASQLDYGDNRFNGNVVDMMVAPSFIDKHFEKFCDLLISGIKEGFFELQTNVIGSSTLIDAKKNPEKYPNLIVRVWGFSAYFIELPENYQDLLIQRALRNEGEVA